MRPVWAPPVSEDPGHRFAWGGFVVASNFDMPRLRPASGTEDIAVLWVRRFSREPLATTTEMELRWPDGGTAMLRSGSDGRRATMSIDEVGTFSLDTEAARIEFVANAGADPMRVEHFIVNTMLGVYAGLCGEVTLHAASAATDGRVTVFAGPSGAGKSTALLRELDNGALLVSDDATVLRRIEGEWFAWPGATTVRLHGMQSASGWDNRGKTETAFSSATGRLPVEKLVLVGARHEDLGSGARQYASLLLQQAGFTLCSSRIRDRLASLIWQLTADVPIEVRAFAEDAPSSQSSV